MERPKTYEKTVIKESGFEIILSNQGNKLMINPNPQNLEGKGIPCLYQTHIDPKDKKRGLNTRCGKPAQSIFGLCKEHNQPGKKSVFHTADWFAMLIPKGFKKRNCESDIIPHYHIEKIIVDWMKENPFREDMMDRFVKDVLETLVGNVPDATTWQNIVENDSEALKLIKNSKAMTPDDIIQTTIKLIDKHFPERDYGNFKLNGGKFKGKSLNGLPLRVEAALLVLAWACEESNRGDAWFCRAHKYNESKYGNAYMPSTYYFLRRHTKATHKQAKMCMKG